MDELDNKSRSESENSFDKQSDSNTDNNARENNGVSKNNQRGRKPNNNQNRNHPKTGQNNYQNRNKPRSQNRNRRPIQENQSGRSNQEKNTNNNRNGQDRPLNGDRHQNDLNGATVAPWGMNPRRTEGGIQTRSQRGEFAKNWWARRWLEALERLMQGVRLTRGQHYARIGQIVSMEEIKGGVTARVQGSRQKPYRVSIQLAPFNNKQWEKVFDLLADKAIYVAQLLAGDMPEDIEDVFNEADVSLFPTRTIDLQTKCTCPDKVTPCKHIAATHYILGDRFDEDPFLLFRMRGRSQDQIMEALRQRRGADVEMTMNGEETPAWQNQPELPRFPETLEHFWNAGPELNEFNVQVRMPKIPQPLLKRLGEPEFASQLTLQGQLEESYNAISQFAILIAYADIANGTSNGEED
jgi:uncharacterized Zn finger protein